jgi:hypothetical protein
MLKQSEINLMTQDNEMTIQKIISFKEPQVLHRASAIKKDWKSFTTTESLTHTKKKLHFLCPSLNPTFCIYFISNIQPIVTNGYN